MKVFKKTMKIYGDVVPSTVIQGSNGEELVRFLVTGTWNGPQDLSKATPNMLVDVRSDKSFDISVQKLIPASIAEDAPALDELVDTTLNSIENELGLDESSLSSMSCYVGFDDTKWDSLMTNEEMALAAVLDSSPAGK